jgi:hypothetical protein
MGGIVIEPGDGELRMLNVHAPNKGFGVRLRRD